MKVLEIYVKNQKDPMIVKGDRIDVLDIELEGKKYKQIRYFRKLISKSVYVEINTIKKMKEKEV